jgi:hypothetical protein
LQYLIANCCDDSGFVNYNAFLDDLIIEICLDSTGLLVAKWHMKQALSGEKRRFLVPFDND